MRNKNTYINISFILLGTLISCFTDFYNGYPLVYSDTGAYIGSGFAGTIPVDRPIFYGLFLRHISLSVSPFLVVFTQGLIISWLLHFTFGMFFAGKKRNIIFITSILFITLTTGFSHNVSILLPDIFCAITLVCFVNLILNKNLNKLNKAILSILFLFGIATHLSNIPILLLLFGFIFLILRIKRIQKKSHSLSIQRVFFTFCLFISSFLLIPSANYLIDKQFKLSSASHVFIVNSFIECGVMKEYLDDVCSIRDYKICEFKDDLGYNFIWRNDSPLYKTGGWENNKTEYKTIILDILSTPKYWPQLINKTLTSSVHQFFSFKTTIDAPHLKGSDPYGQIHWRYNSTLNTYLSSKQNTGELNLSTHNTIQAIVIFISLILLIIVLILPFTRAKLSSELKWSILLILFHIIISAIVSSNLSTVHPRFQNRIIWLLPVLAIIVIVKTKNNYSSIK
jgi:hypothetical protein